MTKTILNALEAYENKTVKEFNNWWIDEDEFKGKTKKIHEAREWIKEMKDIIER